MMENGDVAKTVDVSGTAGTPEAANANGTPWATTPANAKGTLEVDGVQLSFGGTRVLQDVYIRVDAGRVAGLLGRNGCGKSSLMRIIHGSLGPLNSPLGPARHVEASVRVDGGWVGQPFMHGVAYLPPRGFIPGWRRVDGVARDYGLDFERIAATFPVPADRRRARVSTISGGERRVLEACAVLMAPDVRFCLLDEPFPQLSPLHAAALKEQIVNAARGGKGILISDHLYRDVCDVSDSLYVISGHTTHPVHSPGELSKYGYTTATYG
jgi:ABC-type lipopolysaccharide export system ATPase subunit